MYRDTVTEPNVDVAVNEDDLYLLARKVSYCGGVFHYRGTATGIHRNKSAIDIIHALNEHSNATLSHELGR
jgi:hypothetical protein